MSSSEMEFGNAAGELLARCLEKAPATRPVFVDEGGSYTAGTLREMAHCAANGLREVGVQLGERVALCLLDTIDFPVSFLGAILAGIVPVPVSTLWTAEDYAYMLADSGATAAMVSAARLPVFLEAVKTAGWRGKIIVSAGVSDAEETGKFATLDELLKKASSNFVAHPRCAEDECFWLYSSGSTGKPKAAVHRQRSLAETARLFSEGVLGMNSDDVVYSAAKLFFAYGLGNSLTFPMWAGATCYLCSQRPTAETVLRILREQQPTIFFGVPTLFAGMLEKSGQKRAEPFAAQGKQAQPLHESSLRLCVSAGEGLPEHLGRTWKERTGVDIIDGIGSTEMLHVFISNVPGAVKYGTTGRVVPGYQARLLDENGKKVAQGEPGELWVHGPTCCAKYWNQPQKTANTFVDGWTRTGDRFRETADGDFVHGGRSDDLLKVGGIWVSPLEVEAALLAHEAVKDVAVVSCEDEQGLVKPKAFVVLRDGTEGCSALEAELKSFVKSRLAPYKYPRWIEFVEALPRTATGKVQRFRLREFPGANP